MIFEILANLIDNAIRYNRTGGSVTVTIETAASGSSITVADDGPGISPAHRATAFDRFVRFSDGNGPEGSGLGLAIVRSAATRLGATVEFGNPRVGTVVILHFPKATV